MQFFPAALQDLADHFARLPGIGGKTAQQDGDVKVFESAGHDVSDCRRLA